MSHLVRYVHAEIQHTMIAELSRVFVPVLVMAGSGGRKDPDVLEAF